MPEEASDRVMRLRESGYKLTKARLTVLGVLEDHHNHHLTSSEILEAVAERDPDIGRASVFRTLDLLTSLSLIRPTYIDSSATPRYVLLPEGHHHHIVCTRCNRVIEFHNCGLDSLTATLEETYKVRLTGHLLEFYGICRECEDAATN